MERMTVQSALQTATARTQAALDDPDASAYDRYIAVCREEATYATVEPGPCDRINMKPADRCAIDYSAEIEAEAENDEPEIAL